MRLFAQTRWLVGAIGGETPLVDVAALSGHKA